MDLTRRIKIKDLKLKVKKLEEERDLNKQEEILQEINEMLLTEYVIKISDNFIIEPLRVEAYYFHKGKFEDFNSHCSEKQKNRFGKLYLHKKGRGGVDICLSDGNFFLSFLIKNSLIKGKDTFGKQIYLKSELKKYGNDIEEKYVLTKTPKSNQVVFHTVRKNLTKKDSEYKRLALSSLIELKKYPFDLEKGYGKEKIVRAYLKSHPYADCKDLLGYCLKDIRK
jgi:hypothetical protein